MQRVKEAIKEKVGRHRRHEDEYETHGATAYEPEYATGATGTEYATGATGTAGTEYATGMAGGAAGTGEYVGERPVGVGVAEVPVVVTEQERLGAEHHHHHHHGVAGAAGEEVCGVKTFTEVEDRPVVKERVERVLEHRPVEKEYAVETRYVGERPIASSTGATVIDQTERIVEAAEPGPKCPTSAGAMMDEAMGRNI